jgi:glycosyltransferase involved in cell wall biosynthesis
MNIFVVPAYNEALNVPRLLADLESRPSLWRDGGRLLLVDDGSSDGTADVAEAFRGAMPLEVLRQTPNQGAGRAFDRGFRRALELAGPSDRVVTLEADTTSDLDALEEMLEASEHADLVLASVHAGGEMAGVGRHRRFLSSSAARVIRASAGVDARTVSSFFRVYGVEILRKGYARHGDRLIQEPGFACKAELLMKLSRVGARVVEIPVNLDASRREGESKLRVLPTVAGYARLTVRQVVLRVRTDARADA